MIPTSMHSLEALIKQTIGGNKCSHQVIGSHMFSTVLTYLVGSDRYLNGQSLLCWLLLGLRSQQQHSRQQRPHAVFFWVLTKVISPAPPSAAPLLTYWTIPNSTYRDLGLCFLDSLSLEFKYSQLSWESTCCDHRHKLIRHSSTKGTLHKKNGCKGYLHLSQ